MGVGLKYSDNNRLWLTVYTRSFVSCPILSAFKGLCLTSLDNCSENYNNRYSATGLKSTFFAFLHFWLISCEP